MPRLDLEQGSPIWHKYRETRIMATSAAVILGLNPWKDIMQLWEELNSLSLPFKGNSATERGSKLEPDARKLACEVIGIEFKPCVYESDKYYWMAASLDGISSCGSYLLEIKCPNEKTHEMAVNDIIPDYYMAQIQHQLAVTNSQICYYFSYRPENIKKYAIIEVRPDNEFIKDMIEKELAFFSDLCLGQIPIWKFKI